MTELIDFEFLRLILCLGLVQSIDSSLNMPDPELRRQIERTPHHLPLIRSILQLLLVILDFQIDELLVVALVHHIFDILTDS